MGSLKVVLVSKGRVLSQDLGVLGERAVSGDKGFIRVDGGFLS